MSAPHIRPLPAAWATTCGQCGQVLAVYGCPDLRCAYWEGPITAHEQAAIEWEFRPHVFTYSRETRTCAACGIREAYWDDDEYPINPCLAED